MIVFGVIILVILLVFSIWNWFNLRKLKSIQNGGETKLNDEKYYELKYKIEFLKAMASALIVIAGILGYNSLDNAKSQLSTELSNSISSLNNKIISAEKSINDKDSIVRVLEDRLSQITQNLPELDSKAKTQSIALAEIEKKISTINQKNILKQNFYITKSIGMTPQGFQRKFLLDNLTTIEGQKLPNFERAPLIIPVTESNVPIEVFNITHSSFEAGWSTSWGEPDPLNLNPTDSLKFSLIIMEK
jgi:hypothetical protein